MSSNKDERGEGKETHPEFEGRRCDRISICSGGWGHSGSENLFHNYSDTFKMSSCLFSQAKHHQGDIYREVSLGLMWHTIHGR